MRAPALSVAIVLLFISLSCKKDGGETPLVNSTVYNKTGKSQTSPTRLFALSGEITTAAIVNRFNTNDASWLNSLSAQLFPNQGIADNLKVQTEQLIEVSENAQYHPYNVTRNGNSITLTAKDTTKSTSYNEVFTRTIYYQIAKYKPYVFSETLVSSTRGFYLFEYTTLKQYHLEAEQDAIRMPWITGVIHNANGVINSLLMQNKVDINFYKTLAVGDTVVVQEYDLIYEK